jgi:hypothetical protein
MNLTPKVNCQYGAPMGRKSWNDNAGAPYTGKMYLRHAPLDSGGYDAGGAYWGTGRRVYLYATADDSINGSLRAYDRPDAMEQVRALHPNVTFFGEKKHETRAHVWHKATFTGTVTCERCGLLPMDDDDLQTECEGML